MEEFPFVFSNVGVQTEVLFSTGFLFCNDAWVTLTGRSAGTSLISVPVSIALKVWIILAGSSGLFPGWRHSMFMMHCVPAVNNWPPM